MNSVWHFYRDQNHCWRWQHVSIHLVLIAESCTRFGEYERCLADAKGNGYLFQPSQGKKVKGFSRLPRAAREGAPPVKLSTRSAVH